MNSPPSAEGRGCFLNQNMNRTRWPHDGLWDRINDGDSGDGDLRRAASGVDSAARGSRRSRWRFHQLSLDILYKAVDRMCQVCAAASGQRTAGVLLAATGTAYDELVGFRTGRTVTRMHRLAYAASMARRRSRRQRQWNEVPGKGDQQQQSGDEAMHSLGGSKLNRRNQHRTPACSGTRQGDYRGDLSSSRKSLAATTPSPA